MLDPSLRAAEPFGSSLGLKIVTSIPTALLDARRVLGYIRERPFSEFEQIQSAVWISKRKLYDILYDFQTKGLIGMTGYRQEKLLSDDQKFSKGDKWLLWEWHA